MSPVVSCRWDWCRSSFPTVDALDAHVKHDHIWPMRPMRKAEIALMRRMDLQGLHSSLDSDSNITSIGLCAGLSRSNQTPPIAPPTATPENDERPGFDTFTQLSSPLSPDSPQRLPVSPALEGLTKHDRHSDVLAAVRKFERDQRSLQRSPTHRPLSPSSGSSQEVIERQLTQEDNVIPPLRRSEPQNDNELTDTELVWPGTDDEFSSQGILDSGQLASEKDHRPSGSPDSARGQTFRCGSLSVPLGEHSHRASPSNFQVPDADSQESRTSSQPLVLQTQAPYSSQTQ